MSPIQHVLVNLSKFGKKGMFCILVFLVSVSWGTEASSSSASVPQSSSDVVAASSSSESVVVPAAESLLASFEPVLASSSSELLNVGVDANSSSGMNIDSSTFLARQDSSAENTKIVLYLSGGENSPWFLLGVLYAIEEYHIPVDSVVGTSWGAWIGAMWSKGMRLDDMQRLLLEKDFEPFVGHDNIVPKPKYNLFEWPVSKEGFPSLRYRFSVRQDSAGFPLRISKPLVPDTAGTELALAKVRFQESLIRQSLKQKIPFAVLGCDGQIGSTNEDIIRSLPLPGNDMSGEICPYIAMPAEDSPNEFAIIVVADPVRFDVTGNPWQRVLKKYASEGLKNQPGLIIRAHSFPDSSHNARIQAGFSSMETRMNNLSFLQNRRKNYEGTKCEVYPWFRYNPTFDSLSAEKHASAKSFWNAQDTGIVAPRNFAYAMIQNPVYDSLTLDMQPNGDLIVGAKSSPVFDIALGGFGSNAIGPNAYAEIGLRYINQMEFHLNLAGFYGYSSYGLLPEFNIEKLWNEKWSLKFAYEWMKLRPLETFNNDLPSDERIYSEKRSDLKASVEYKLDEMQVVSLNVLFGSREFDIEIDDGFRENFKTFPVSPNLRYEFLRGAKDEWFSDNSFAVTGNLGLESVGLELGRSDFIPIYMKAILDLQYSFAPTKHTSFTVGASGGFDRRVSDDETDNYENRVKSTVEKNDEFSYSRGNSRDDDERNSDDGFFKFPNDFEYSSVANYYRLHPRATPWTTEWTGYNLASHCYGMLRMSGGLHYKGSGLWLFGAYVHDFEDNPHLDLGVNKIVVEPAFRISYKSFSAYVGMNRVVDFDTAKDVTEFGDYSFFIRIGNYDLF